MGVDPLYIPQKNSELMNDALAGKFTSAPAGLNPKIYDHLMEGRALIDDFSDRLLAQGFLKPDTKLYNEFIGNKGKYVAVMYRIFTDPRFRPEGFEVGGVPQTYAQMRAAAIPAHKQFIIGKGIKEAGDAASRWYRPGTEAYNRARRLAEAAAKARLDATVTDGIAEHDLDRLLAGYRQVAEAKDKQRLMFGPAFVLNDSLLQDVTKLKPEVRRLMGEEQDVRKNMVNTISRQMNYLQAIDLSHQWKLEGGGKYFGADYNLAKNWTHQLHSGQAHLGELAGMYTSREIHDVLMGYASLATNLPDIMPGMHALEGATRYMTTILSVRRGMGNIWSSAFQMLQNGMIDPRNVPQAGKAIRNYLHYMFGGTNKQIEAQIQDAFRYGLLDKSTDPFTLRNMTEHGYKYMMRGPLDALEGIQAFAQQNKWLARAGALRVSAAEFAQKFHTAGNDMSKMFQWDVQQKFVRDYNAEDVAAGRAAPMTEDQIKREAARIVIDTNISYSLASPFIKAGRRYPVVAPFLTFWGESMRSYATQWGYALDYLRSGNTVKRNQGIARLAGLIASASFAGVLANTAMRIFGVTPREDQNLRKMLPPWEQNMTRIYGPMINGRRQYMNLNYVMPQGDLARAVIAALTPNKDGITGRTMDAVKELVHPMINFGLIPGALVDTLRNQTEYGTQVYNPEDHFLKYYGGMDVNGWGADVLRYLGTRMFGGTLGRGGRQLASGQIGTVSRGGTVYDPNILLGSELLGLDLHELSIPDRFRARLFSSRDQLYNAEKIFTGPIQRNVLTDNDMRAAYQHMEAVRQIVFGNLHDMTEAARNSGMTTAAIRSAFKERRYPTQLINDLLAGRYHPYIPGKNVLDEARHAGNHMPTGLFSHSARNYQEQEE
jgi:hypothetical protein